MSTLTWALLAALQAWPGAEWSDATPAEMGLDAGKLEEARDYALTGGGSGIITRGGRRVIVPAEEPEDRRHQGSGLRGPLREQTSSYVYDVGDTYTVHVWICQDQVTATGTPSRKMTGGRTKLKGLLEKRALGYLL